MELGDYESGHRVSISNLVGKFGSDMKDEIEILYHEQRRLLEDRASVKKYLPIIAEKRVCEILQERVSESDLVGIE